MYLCWRKIKPPNFTTPAAFYVCVLLLKEKSFCSAMRERGLDNHKNLEEGFGLPQGMDRKGNYAYLIQNSGIKKDSRLHSKEAVSERTMRRYSRSLYFFPIYKPYFCAMISQFSKRSTKKSCLLTRASNSFSSAAHQVLCT